MVMVWNGYFEYRGTSNHVYAEDPAWVFLLVVFIWGLWGFGCLSASFTMERMKTKTSRTSMLMVPATPFEKFFSRWFVFTVVYLVVFLISYKLADYTRLIIYSLAYPEKDFIAPVALSHVFGDEKYYTLCNSGLEFGALMSGYFFVQSLFVLGSSIWPKNSFLKTFAAGTIIGIIYFLGRCFGKQNAVGKRPILFGRYFRVKRYCSMDHNCCRHSFYVAELDTGLFPF